MAPNGTGNNSNVPKYVSCSNKYDISRLAVLIGVCKVNIAKKCVFPILGAVPGDCNFGVLKIWLNLKNEIFCIWQ